MYQLICIGNYFHRSVKALMQAKYSGRLFPNKIYFKCNHVDRRLNILVDVFGFATEADVTSVDVEVVAFA